ncbi:Malate dehydrogenase (oxaloacetate-decarboxylating) [Chloroherpeton thalassium ATCC 35110]|uniref:Malate dehydrogenase (Oxaloacetate-decarboxylating) n=1 Tax=Chloroherpeton thalassium (strain ATCC 35110 / GB-78) TaxID=517418 RepID=B3QYN6_CHLT3|nr:NADP-dependent malic enzyme [Chloroherpeton thalassium]ACF15109.1 Malate dehydrogenase (oxaloacetate-decarboxylating) [Chloroherpeton thalassium ATCC 35110]
MDIYQESLDLHQKLGGKLSIASKVQLQNRHDLSLAYTPGVAEVSRVVAKNPEKAYELTLKKNTIAIVSDGSAVLGLGNIGAYGAIPVMEGKAVLFKEYADIDAFPICVQTQNTYEIISLVKNIAPVFAGVNLEDIAAPRCFEIEAALQDIGIPVFHDDQHGTAIVLLAALINAAKLAEKELTELKVVINGAGAAGTAIVELLLCVGYDPTVCTPVKEIIICDSKGIISRSRSDLQQSAQKMKLAMLTNREDKNGSLSDAMHGADVFIGVSVGDLVSQEMVRSMAKNPIILAMANPIPEIMPEEAKAAGACIVGTGRSDFPNQVNNVLAFPGVFRGAMDAKASRITPKMKLLAAYALANYVKSPSPEEILPSVLDKEVGRAVAKAVAEAWKSEQTA